MKLRSGAKLSVSLNMANEFSLYLLKQVLGWINKVFTESLQTPCESQTNNELSVKKKLDGLLL